MFIQTLNVFQCCQFKKMETKLTQTNDSHISRTDFLSTKQQQFYFSLYTFQAQPHKLAFFISRIFLDFLDYD